MLRKRSAREAAVAKVRIGVSGWSYAHWRGGAFYPEEVTQRRELEYLGRRFATVEINGSFYSLLRPQTYARYHEQVPAGFVFAVKGGQFITHSKKLKDVQVPLANFFASGVLRLEERLGPLLWQLPQRRWPAGRVEDFLELLPADTIQASRLARRHDRRVSGRASLAVDRNRTLRHALEVRHPALLSEPVVRACRRHSVALVFSHNGGDWPYHEEITAGWCYLRLHGAPHTYASPYRRGGLDHWAERIRRWAEGGEPSDPQRLTSRKPPARKGRDVYVYFDNDKSGYAPRDALALCERIGRQAQR
jgi:uncharacterized protein YecE (DUF72 family)